MKKALSRRYYRLGLAAAKEWYLSAALRYAQCASDMDPQNTDAARLAQLCRYELEGSPDEELLPGEAAVFIQQKKWSKAARLLGKVSHQSIRLLAIQGCLWALAKRRTLSDACFSRVLAKDRGNPLALQALTEQRPQRNFFWRFF
ncbi:hypothetical protein ACYULU_05630 [Breznakiellaceae bacterium SP9]